MTYFVHIYYEGKGKHERHFKISDENFKEYMLYHAFWTLTYTEVMRTLFESFGINFKFHNINDFQKAEIWLNNHKEA